MPDAGDAQVCGHSVLHQLAAARRKLGYCPQASALPGALTGREVLRLYARLRGVPPGLLEAAIASILRRLDLTDSADKSVLLLSPFEFAPWGLNGRFANATVKRRM